MTAWPSGAFVGRLGELERLEEGVRQAAAGRGGTILLAGDAGMGKTRLVSELGVRARAAGAQPLLGRCIDLVGAEVPYLPVAEAVRPLLAREDVRGLLRSARELRWLLPEAVVGEEHTRRDGPARSQLGLLEELLALLEAVAAAAPVVLILEDLHWADRSTLDLVAFLARNLGEQRMLLLGTYRGDELSAGHPLRRLVTGLLRAGVATPLELGPLGRDELEALLLFRSGQLLPPALREAIVIRSEGNPFFAEELLAAAGKGDVDLPHLLRDLLLQRVAQLDRQTHGVLRVVAAVGRDVPYPLLRAVVDAPEGELRQSLRRAVEHGVLVGDQAAGTFRFRHALLAEAIYGTLLPGEREELHARLAAELAGSPHRVAAELAQHWAAARRAPEALAASVAAGREAEAVFGLAEAVQHLERALELWDLVPEAAELTGLDLAALLEWTAEVSDQTGAGPRAVELIRRAIALGAGDPVRAALLHEHLGRFLLGSGSYEAALAAFGTAVELVPAEPVTPERAHVLAALGHALMLGWRHDQSREVCERALELAREIGARRSAFRALAVLGVDLAYLGRGEEGLGCLWEALHLAEDLGVPEELGRAYTLLADVLTMLGRQRESVQVAATGIALARRYGREHGRNMPLAVNLMEALVDLGEWEEADRVGAAAIRAGGAPWPHQRLVARAVLDIGHGDYDRAREGLQAALATVHDDKRGRAAFDIARAELALWERRWDDAEHAVGEGLQRLPAREAALLRVRLCVQGLRAQAELAALARARRDGNAVTDRLQRARRLLGEAREAATGAAAVTPTAAAWRAIAEAEYDRARKHARPRSWEEAAAAWAALQRPPIVAYCSWRQVEALVAAGAPAADAALAARDALAIARRLGARPLQEEIERLARLARLDLAPPVPRADQGSGLADLLGLTPREAEVLGLVAQGYSNGQIAAALVISVKTASVHVSHILAKLQVQNRVEAAAIAHRVVVEAEVARPPRAR